jgi:hypothetical protein
MTSNWDAHIAPPPKDRPLVFDVNAVNDESSTIEAGYVVTNQMLKGEITPIEADSVMSVLHKVLTLGRLAQIDERLAHIEARLGVTTP